MSTRNEEPERASRPFDRERDGFVHRRGRRRSWCSKTLEHAAGARRAHLLPSWSATAPTATPTTSPSPAPEGARRRASACAWRWTSGGIDPLEVDYINAHGTSTPYNDVNETQAIKRVFGEHAARLAVSSTKSMTGHLLGGAGGIEAVYTVLAVAPRRASRRRSTTRIPIPSATSTTCPTSPAARRVRVALSNSFGFGGANACVAFRRWDG